MARSRVGLNDIFKEILGSGNVYFNPPESLKLNYPCIVYNYDSGDSIFADDSAYQFNRKYSAQYISKKADDIMSDRIATEIPMCTMGRNFIQDNMYHYNYTIYY